MCKEKRLIKKLKRYSVSAQKELYETYAVDFKRMCLNYVNSDTDADDILHEGFIKIFKNINQFSGKGSFEGWMKRIIINTALKQYRKERHARTQMQFDDINETKIANTASDDSNEFIDRKDVNENDIDYSLVEQADFSKEEMLEIIDLLKDDFKIVFNLYFHENYKHQEIAEILNIDEKTSRSRLSRARKFVQKELYKICLDRVTL